LIDFIRIVVFGGSGLYNFRLIHLGE